MQALMQVRHGSRSCAMARRHYFDPVTFQALQGLGQSFFTGVLKVHAPDYGINRRPLRKSGNVIQRVDNARVGAAQEHDTALGTLDPDGLIIFDRIRNAAGRIRKEKTSRIFKFIVPGNGAGYPDIFQNLLWR